MNKKLLSSFFLAALLTGCAHTPPSPPPTKIVRFESDPSGQRVFLEYTANEGTKSARDFAGTTPCTASIPVNRNGTVRLENGGVPVISGYVPPSLIISCEPIFGETNLFIQKTILHGEAHWHKADIVPDAIFFDMHQQ